MLFGIEYELAREIQRDRLARADRSHWLQMIKAAPAPALKKWVWRLRLGWKTAPKTAL